MRKIELFENKKENKLGHLSPKNKNKQSLKLSPEVIDNKFRSPCNLKLEQKTSNFNLNYNELLESLICSVQPALIPRNSASEQDLDNFTLDSNFPKPVIPQMKKNTDFQYKSMTEIQTKKMNFSFIQTKKIKDFHRFTEENFKKIISLESPKPFKRSLENLDFEPQLQTKKLLIFDLDQILISTTDVLKGAQYEITVCEKFKVGVNIRPHAKEALTELRKNYVLIIFTSTQKAYADEIIDLLDPEGDIFSYRIYKENCRKVPLGNETIYIKDLSIFKTIDIRKIVIIDYSVLSFAYNLNNGIPILPYYDDENDNELMSLVNYLSALSTSSDVRVENEHFINLMNCLKIAKGDFNDSEYSEDELDNDVLVLDGPENHEEEENEEYQVFVLKPCEKIEEDVERRKSNKKLSRIFKGVLNQSLASLKNVKKFK